MYIMWALEFNCMRPQQTGQKCLLLALNLSHMRTMKGFTHANKGQSATVHSDKLGPHLVCKGAKLKGPAWFRGDAVAVYFPAV